MLDTSKEKQRQTGSRRKSKNKVSIFVDDNIIPEPDVALELGKSISLAKAEEEEVIRHVHATHERLVSESDEPSGEPANRQTGKRRSFEQLAANTMQALKAIKKSSRSQPYTGGSSEGAGVTLEVPDESTAILITSSEGTGSKEESEYSDEENVNEEVEWLTTDEEEEKKDNDEDDRSINLKKTNDDEETDDEFVHGDEYVHDDVDKEMKDAEVVDTGKDDEEITDAEKVDVEKTKEVKGDNKKDELPPTSSSLSDIIDADINSLLDIQIQQDVPHIQSPSILTVLVSVIPEPTVLSLIPNIPTVTPVTTLPPHPSVTNLTTVLQQTKITILTSPITTIALAATTCWDLKYFKDSYYCSVSAAGYKDTIVAGLQLLEDLLLSRG
ncbi:hypothetical protein Tco_1286755 [Tanacetum coccineum]